MNSTLVVLSEIIKQYPMDEKLLFVPSYSIGHQIGESLSRSGTSWINLKVKTLPGGPWERTITYTAPFDNCDREADYATAWAAFERRGKAKE